MRARAESTPAVLSGAPSEVAEAVSRAWREGRPFVVAGGRGTPPPASAPFTGDAAAVVATSGTTGAPRFVAHRRTGIEASCRAVNEALAVDRDRDHWLACVPLDGVAGLAIVLRAEVAGVPVTVHDRFDVEAVARAAGECTLVSLVATQLARLLDARAPLARFRAVLLGGGPIPEVLLARARDEGVRVHTTYGMTETFGGCVHDGRPLRGAEITVAPATGEILVRGPMVMQGYLGDDVATRAAFTDDGRLRTGDTGAWAEDGRLTVVDRLKDLVITGGVNVSPVTVERVLSTHPDVVDVCVTGAPDDQWGERVVAYVVARDPASAPTVDALRDFARSRLAPPELPREVRLVDAIPRTPGGKPLRRALG